MYDGGDAVEVALACVLAVQWYTVTGRRRARAAARSGGGHPRQASGQGGGELLRPGQLGP